MKMLKPNKSRNQDKRPLFNMYWMYGLIALSLLALYYFQDGSQTKDGSKESEFRYVTTDDR